MADGQYPGNYTELSPDILMFNILPRLPTKSVGRFRCVSRGWKSFLTTPHFAKMQLLLHQTEDYHQNQKLLVLSTTRPYTFRTIDCETPTMKDGLSPSRPLPFIEVGSRRAIHYMMWIVASLHGLVCINRRRLDEESHKSTDLILWNPLTSNYKTLSKPTSQLDYWSISYEGVFGLYYTTSDDDYKLLCVTNHTNPKLYIYSLKSDLWRKVETTNRLTSNCIDSEYLDIPNVLLNEKLYFLKMNFIHRVKDPIYFIMMFDTKTEKLREIATPALRNKWEYDMRLMVVRGSIHCCVCVPFTDSHHTIELWRMDGHGDGDWTKLGTYSLIDRPWKPLHIMRNGYWLMYNYDQGHVSQLDMNKHTYDIICTFKNMQIWKYMESLVSPNQYIN